MPSGDSEPWWNAGDDKFAGATPLFEGERAPADSAAEEEPTDSAPPGADGAESADTSAEGSADSPIMEALRLAAALSAWSEQSGLTETLRGLAAQAGEQLGSLADTDNPVLHLVTEEHDEGGPSAGSTCAYCPLCRGVDILRVVQPQVAQGVAEAMASLTTALNAAVASFAEQQRSNPGS